MKNFKKVLSLVLALSLLVSTMTISFAAVDTTAEKADVLNALGLLNGVSEEEFDPALDVEANRQTAMVLLARAFGWELDEEATTDFEDVADWAVPAVAKAVELGVTEGMGEGVYGALEMVTARQVATWVERLLTGSETAWEDNADLDNEESVTRGGLVDVIWATLSETPVGAEESLIETIIGDDLDLLAVAQEAGLVEVVTEVPLAVKSVNADNARQVVVEFTEDVTDASITTDNVKVYVGTSTTVTTWTKNLVGAVLTLGLTADVPQDTDVKVVVANVVSATDANEKVAETTTTVRMKDVTAPSIFSVATTTSKTFTLAVSEPLVVAAGEQVFHVLNNITIDGVKLVGKITPDYAKNTLTVELGSKLAVGDHPIVVSGMKDIVGFSAGAFNGTLTVVADTTTASIASVEFVDKATIKVTFDEPVATLGTVTVDSAATTNTAVSADKKTFTLTIATPLGLASLVKSTISYNGTVDMEGNTITTAKTFDFVATDDLVAPTVTLSINSANKVKAVFSETMSAAGTLTVKNSSGATVNVGALALDATDTTNKTYVSANAIGATAGTYTVELKDSKDNSVRANTITAVSVSLATFDVTAPLVSQVIVKTAYAAGPPVVNGQATVYFNEAMDVATLSNLANYLVDLDGGGAGVAVQLSSITSAAASVAADAKSVVLTIPGATFAAGTTTISVLGVKDAAGNLVDIADFNVAQLVAAAAPALTESGFDLVAVNKVKITYTNALTSVDPSNFKLYKNDGTTLAFVGVAYELNAAGTELTVTFNGNLTTAGYVEAADAGLAKLVITAGNTKDIYGNVSSEAAVLVDDDVAPTIAIATGTNAGEIKITFSEAVDATDDTTLNNDLIVRDKNGAIVTLDTSAGNATLTGGTPAITDFTTITVTGLTTGDTYTVELISRSIVDLDGVKVTGVTATSVVAK